MGIDAFNGSQDRNGQYNLVLGTSPPTPCDEEARPKTNPCKSVKSIYDARKEENLLLFYRYYSCHHIIPSNRNVQAYASNFVYTTQSVYR
jgi:hypothetical protein